MNAFWIFRRRIMLFFERTKSGAFIVWGASLVLFPLLLTAGVEYLVRGSWTEAWSWILQHKPLFALNALLQLCVLLFVYSLLGSIISSIGLTAALMTVAALISFYKTKLIGEPFLPWDIVLKKEGMNIIPLVTEKDAMIRLGAVAGAIVALFLLRLVVPRMRLPLITRLTMLVCSLGVLYAFVNQNQWVTPLLNRAGESEIVWNQQQNYEANGMTLAFTLNAKNAIVHKPPGYGEPSVAAAAQTIEAHMTRITACSC